MQQSSPGIYKLMIPQNAPLQCIIGCQCLFWCFFCFPLLCWHCSLSIFLQGKFGVPCRRRSQRTRSKKGNLKLAAIWQTSRHRLPDICGISRPISGRHPADSWIPGRDLAEKKRNIAISARCRGHELVNRHPGECWQIKYTSKSHPGPLKRKSITKTARHPTGV